MFQTASRPISTGRLCSSGALWKCSSTVRKPASMSANASGPIASIVESPIAEHNEYLPPTQSQNPNELAGSMPNAATSSRFVDTATKCLATARSSPPNPSSSHARAVRAFVIVSRVVNVFDATMKSVSAGSRASVASAKSVPSTFETKRNVRSRRE